MHLAMSELIIVAVVVAYFAAVVLVLRTRRGSISEHPYRDPYGDAPGAGRTKSPVRDVHESIRSAPGTR